MPPPSVKIDGLSSAWDHGQQASFNMIFEGLDEWDQYGYRADVTNADDSADDDCEGTGLVGANQQTAQLTGAVGGKLTVPGAIDAGCPSATYTLTVTLMADGGYSYTATQTFQVNGISLSPIETDTPTADRDQYAPTPEPTATNPTAATKSAATTAASRNAYQHTAADGYQYAHARTDRHSNRSADTHANSKSRLCAAPAKGRPDIDAYPDRHGHQHPRTYAYGHPHR